MNGACLYCLPGGKEKHWKTVIYDESKHIP